MIDPFTLVFVGGVAGVEQAQDHFKEYGQGAQGYGKRFGAGYAETPQGRSRFRGNAIEALRRVKVVYPQLKIEIRRDGVLLYPSLTHIPKSAPV